MCAIKFSISKKYFFWVYFFIVSIYECLYLFYVTYYQRTSFDDSVSMYQSNVATRRYLNVLKCIASSDNMDIHRFFAANHSFTVIMH